MLKFDFITCNLALLWIDIKSIIRNRTTMQMIVYFIINMLNLFFFFLKEANFIVYNLPKFQAFSLYS